MVKPLSLGDCQKWQNSRDNGVSTEITIENPINYKYTINKTVVPGTCEYRPMKNQYDTCTLYMYTARNVIL